MATSFKQEPDSGSRTTIILGTEMNAKASGAQVDGATVFDNTSGEWFIAEAELHLDGFGGNVSAGAIVYLYERPSDDNTTFMDSSTTSMRLAAAFPLRTGDGLAQNITRSIRLPSKYAKYSLVFSGTGQTTNANNNSFLKIRGVRTQGV